MPIDSTQEVILILSIIHSMRVGFSRSMISRWSTPLPTYLLYLHLNNISLRCFRAIVHTAIGLYAWCPPHLGRWETSSTQRAYMAYSKRYNGLYNMASLRSCTFLADLCAKVPRRTVHADAGSWYPNRLPTAFILLINGRRISCICCCLLMVAICRKRVY